MDIDELKKKLEKETGKPVAVVRPLSYVQPPPPPQPPRPHFPTPVVPPFNVENLRPRSHQSPFRFSVYRRFPPKFLIDHD